MKDRKGNYKDTRNLLVDFEVGDSVLYVDPIRGKAMNFVGRVTALLSGLGMVDVEFPWGNQRMSPTEIVHTNLDGPSQDTSLDTWDRKKGGVTSKDFIYRLAARHEFRQRRIFRHADNFRQAGIDQMDAYDWLYAKYAQKHTDDEIKAAVSVVYNTPRSERQAMYWKQKGRQYVPTQNELDSGNFHCPRCKCGMEKTIYKKWEKLYACPDCLFLIKPADILDSLDDAAREEAEEQYGWDPQVSDPSKSFNEWL